MPKEKTKKTKQNPPADLALDHTASETPSTSSSSPAATQLTGRGQINISDVQPFRGEGKQVFYSQHT